MVHEFECVKYLWSKFTLVDVIVLRGDMDDKLDAALLGTLGHRLHLLHIDFPLDLVLLDVVEGFIGQQENSALLLHPSIDLDDNARENNFLSLCGVKLGLDLWVRCATTVVLEFV